MTGDDGDSNASPDSQDAEPGAVGVFNVAGMAVGQVFQGTSTVTSMDFHEDGELCVTANSDR